MSRAIRPFRNALFALGIAAALGFGVHEAFASGSEGRERACTKNRDCWFPEQCGPAGGVCNQGTCVCY